MNDNNTIHERTSNKGIDVSWIFKYCIPSEILEVRRGRENNQLNYTIEKETHWEKTQINKMV